MIIMMDELKNFRKCNALTQADLAAFLGVSAPFITRVEKGANRLPQDKFDKLLSNDRGWDVSMLTAETAVRAECPRAVQAPDDAACLRARVSELESALAHERETTRRLLALLEKLSGQ